MTDCDCRGESEGGECDVVTGVQVRDCDVSLLVLEGLSHGAVSRLWSLLPRHSSQGLCCTSTLMSDVQTFTLERKAPQSSCLLKTLLNTQCQDCY